MPGFTLQKLGLRIKNKWITDFLAEVLCTFILAIFVYSTGAQFLLTLGPGSSTAGKALGGAVGLMIAVYTGIKASGASANPNVTLMFCLLGKLPWKKLPLYVLGELVGAFLAAVVTYALYEDLLDGYDGGARMFSGPNATVQLFTSFPHPAISKSTGFFDIVVGTAFLAGSIAAITDKNNANPSPGTIPLIFLFMLYGILMAFGANTGAAINFAIDLSGRSFAAIKYGTDVFYLNDHWFWVPLVAGITGAIVASFVYQLFVGNHLEDISEKYISKHIENDLNSPGSPVNLKAYKSSISVVSNDTLVSTVS